MNSIPSYKNITISIVIHNNLMFRFNFIRPDFYPMKYRVCTDPKKSTRTNGSPSISCSGIFIRIWLRISRLSIQLLRRVAKFRIKISPSLPASGSKLWNWRYHRESTLYQEKVKLFGAKNLDSVTKIWPSILCHQSILIMQYF